MTTAEEIERRVQQFDTARSARRAAAARQVGELAGRRATIVTQLAEVERQLGEVVADAQDVIDVDELAAFTDLKPSDLTRWLTGHKPARGKRRKAATATSAQGTSSSLAGSSAPVSEQETSSGNGGSAGTDKSEPLVARAS